MDNADDPLLRLLPYIAQSSRGNVIITTRNAIHALLAPKSRHHLEGLSTEDAVSFILTASDYKDTKENRALAGAIVKVLGNLPLALAQAAAYIFIHQCLSNYVVLFQQSAERSLATRQPELPYDYPSSVAAAIQMSLDRLPIRALNTLCLFAHLESTSIPHAIISIAAERKFRRVEETYEPDLSTQTTSQAEALMTVFCVDRKWSEADFNDLVTCCLQYSLLRLTTQGNDRFYSMHILVQSYLRAKVDMVQGHRPGQLIVRLLGSASTSSVDYTYLAFNRLLLPHLRQIRMEDVVEAGDHYGFGNVMERAGDNKSAVPHLERCVEIWRRSLGDENKNTLWAMGNLAVSYKAIGSFQKALELEEKVLDVRETTLGAVHHETLLTAGNLAKSYNRVGRYKEAVELGEKVLESQKRVLGPEDDNTVLVMGNLALSYKYLGRNQEALELEEQVLEIRRRVLGPEVPYTLWAMNNLAESYRTVGRKQEALELNWQALKAQERVLGPEHPHTLYSIRARLYILRDLGMMEQLRDLLRVTLPAHERVLGMEHPNVARVGKDFRAELALISGGQHSGLS
jgi:tetratricopeptide (TPR) repeat protein